MGVARQQSVSTLGARTHTRARTDVRACVCGVRACVACVRAHMRACAEEEEWVWVGAGWGRGGGGCGGAGVGLPRLGCCNFNCRQHHIPDKQASEVDLRQAPTLPVRQGACHFGGFQAAEWRPEVPALIWIAGRGHSLTRPGCRTKRAKGRMVP